MPLVKEVNTVLLNLEKQRDNQNRIQKPIADEK